MWAEKEEKRGRGGLSASKQGRTTFTGDTWRHKPSSSGSARFDHTERSEVKVFLRERWSLGRENYTGKQRTKRGSKAWMLLHGTCVGETFGWVDHP